MCHFVLKLQKYSVVLDDRDELIYIRFNLDFMLINSFHRDHCVILEWIS